MSVTLNFFADACESLRKLYGPRCAGPEEPQAELIRLLHEAEIVYQMLARPEPETTDKAD